MPDILTARTRFFQECLQGQHLTALPAAVREFVQAVCTGLLAGQRLCAQDLLSDFDLVRSPVVAASTLSQDWTASLPLLAFKQILCLSNCAAEQSTTASGKYYTSHPQDPGHAPAAAVAWAQCCFAAQASSTS